MTKKKWLFLLLALFLFLPFFGGKGIVASAETTEEEKQAEEELQESISDLLDKIDLTALQEYLDTLTEFHGISLKDKLKGLVDGDLSLDYDSLGEMLLHTFLDDISLLLPAFAMILAASLLCGVLNSAKSGFLHSTMSDIIGMVSYLAVGAVVLSCLISVLGECFSAIGSLGKQMELVYPVLLTLMAASGGSVSAAIFRPAVTFLSSGILKLFSSVVLPVCVSVLVLGFVGNLSPEVRTEKLGDFFKSISRWLIGLSLGLFGLFLTVQGIAAAQYDGISLRTVKYVISGSVPVVGGFLSGSVDLVLAGSALIKNALGSFSVLLLAAVVLKPLLLLAATQLFLRIAAAATEPVGGKIPVLLSRLAGDLGYCTASLLSVAFLYFLTLLLLVCSSGVL